MPETSLNSGAAQQKVSPEQVRDYLDLLTQITYSFNSEQIGKVFLQDLAGDEYTEICNWLLRMIRTSGMHLSNNDLTAVQLMQPPRTFEHDYLLHGYAIYRADQIVTAEAEFLSCCAMQPALFEAYRKEQKALNDLAKVRRADRAAQQAQQEKLRQAQRELQKLYEDAGKATKKFCMQLNLAYAKEYRYGHVPLDGPLAPVLPKNYNMTEAQVECADNEFYHSLIGDEISRALHLNMLINHLT